MDDESKYTFLLNQLKSSVERFLECHSSNKWDLYGRLQRLYVAVTEVLEHGFRFLKENGKPDLWVFIQGLSWLQPTLAASPSFFGHLNTSSPVRSSVRSADKAITWLYTSIDNYTLSEKLSWLLSDHEHLLSCYNADAFLRQVQYSEATLICLQALEKRQVSLLAKIDPKMYVNKKIVTKKHRRCLSYPEPNITDNNNWTVEDQKQKLAESEILDSISITPEVKIDFVDSPNQTEEMVTGVHNKCIDSIFKSSVSEKQMKNVIKEKLMKKWFSCSDVYKLSSVISCSLKVKRQSSTDFVYAQSVYSDAEDQNFSKLLAVNYDKVRPNHRSKEHSTISDCKSEDISDTEDNELETRKHTAKTRRRKRASFFKLPFRIWNDSDDDDDDESICSGDSKTLVDTNACLGTSPRKSFIENEGIITFPLCTGAFPIPSPGQSIISFLTSEAFTQMSAELDRENAHFHISEAMIAAMEQVKFNQQIKETEDLLEESDEEINRLKRIIRMKRRQKENVRSMWTLSGNENTDNTTTATDQSVNSLSSSSVYSTSDSISTDQEGDADVRIDLGLSVSKLSLFSDELNDYGSDISASAENVAISLLRKFKENQLPAASDIEWLVSERDAPQQILPLPSSIQVDDPSDRFEKSNSLLRGIRGTVEWAPPRPQIIFTPHPRPSRQLLMEKQMNRCAGCGTTVAPKYVSKFRYCEYLGRYFCPGCHSQQTAIIPGKVLHKWDFSRYPVSNFSYQLLDQMYTDPLFNVLDLNEELYCRIRDLRKTRVLRLTLFYLKDFIFTCKYADRLKDMILEEPSHIYNDPDNYSMADFVRVKTNKFIKTVTAIIKNCESHVNNCSLCQARGFMCEICKKQGAIFPWQLDKVVRCKDCGSCHHIKCYQRKMACPKCIRIINRNDLNKIGTVQTAIS